MCYDDPQIYNSIPNLYLKFQLVFQLPSQYFHFDTSIQYLKLNIVFKTTFPSKSKWLKTNNKQKPLLYLQFSPS